MHTGKVYCTSGDRYKYSKVRESLKREVPKNVNLKLKKPLQPTFHMTVVAEKLKIWRHKKLKKTSATRFQEILSS